MNARQGGIRILDQRFVCVPPTIRGLPRGVVYKKVPFVHNIACLVDFNS